MHFQPTPLADTFLIRPEPRSDERGHFARQWCESELAQHGLVARIAQVNSGFNPKAGTLRGLHWQAVPHAEVKVARCTRGAVFDVAVDLRRDSPTYRRWTGHVLSAENALMLYIPPGCAHGYLTLEADSELMYFTSEPYSAASARGARHDDPAFAVEWPAPVVLMSAADAGWPAFSDAAACTRQGNNP